MNAGEFEEAVKKVSLIPRQEQHTGKMKNGYDNWAWGMRVWARVFFFLLVFTLTRNN